ncbi:MAG: hypothetical protein AAFX99_10445 [Myxococcota bacterium]
MMESVDLLHSLVKEMNAMELFGQAYETLKTARADEYAQAVVQGSEEQYLRGLLRDLRRSQGATHITYSQVLHDPSGEGLGQHPSTAYVAGDPKALAMLPKVHNAAYARANPTMRQYLDWLMCSARGESDVCIATREGRSEATIRGGRKRAIDFLIEVAHDLRHGGTTCDGALPPALQQAADCLLEQALEEAQAHLTACAGRWGDDPRWFNIAGLVALGQGRYDQALHRLRQGLIMADSPALRAKLLNNQGKVLHNMGLLKQAQASYLRAWRLMPQAAPPLLNLLAVASERHDLQDCRYYANQLVELLREGHLSPTQRETVMDRLSNNPLYDWVRRTVAWKGPARWLRRWAQAAAVALVTLVLALSLSTSPSWAQDGPMRAPHVPHHVQQVSPIPTPTGAGIQRDKGEGWVRFKSDNTQTFEDESVNWWVWLDTWWITFWNLSPRWDL